MLVKDWHIRLKKETIMHGTNWSVHYTLKKSDRKLNGLSDQLSQEILSIFRSLLYSTVKPEQVNLQSSISYNDYLKVITQLSKPKPLPQVITHSPQRYLDLIPWWLFSMKEISQKSKIIQS